MLGQVWKWDEAVGAGQRLIAEPDVHALALEVDGVKAAAVREPERAQHPAPVAGAAGDREHAEAVLLRADLLEERRVSADADLLVVDLLRRTAGRDDVRE